MGHESYTNHERASFLVLKLVLFCGKREKQMQIQTDHSRQCTALDYSIISVKSYRPKLLR